MRVYTFPTRQGEVHKAAALYKAGHTTYVISQTMGKSRATISIYLKCAGVDTSKRRHAKYGLNTGFFNEINTHVKAYWLGFVLADGHVTKDGSTLVTELQARDRGHLEAFARDVSFTGPLRDTVHRRVRNGRLEVHRAVRLDLCSREMTSALSSAGWDEFKKEGGLRIVKSIPERLLLSLLRGLFDGDGSLALYKGQLFFSFTDKHRSVVEWYQDELIRELGLSKITVRPARRGCAWTFRYGGNVQVRSILRWLESAPGPNLARKRRKAISPP